MLSIACQDPGQPDLVQDTLVVTRELFQTLPGQVQAVARGVNDAGALVGESWGGGYTRGTRWGVGVPPADLGPPGDALVGPSTFPTSINQSGVVAGYITPEPELYIAVRWDTVGVVDTLGFGRAFAVNNRRQVVGCYLTPQFRYWMAVLWSADGEPQDLGTLGGNHSCAYAINDSGWVAGGAWTADQAEHAFLWKPDMGMIDLGTLSNISRAYGMNNHGEVVGFTGDAEHGNLERPFYWTAETGIKVLPIFPLDRDGRGRGAAYAINDAGDIVGFCTINKGRFPGVENATLWRSISAPPLNLTGLAIPKSEESTLSRAFAISSSGLIAGWDAPFNNISGGSSWPRAALWMLELQN